MQTWSVVSTSVHIQRIGYVHIYDCDVTINVNNYVTIYVIYIYIVAYESSSVSKGMYKVHVNNILWAVVPKARGLRPWIPQILAE